MSGEFYADDFEIIDTQYKIEDFELNADASKTGVDIALVMDCSGNMSEEALEDAEKAAQACAEDMDTGRQQMAVVTYSDEARTLVSRTNDPESLIYGIHQSSRGGRHEYFRRPAGGSGCAGRRKRRNESAYSHGGRTGWKRGGHR